MKNTLKQLPFAPGKLFIVDNYLEAVGIMTALKSDVAPEAVRRALEETKVCCQRADSNAVGPEIADAATSVEN